MPLLTTDKYVSSGTYIGQLISPSAGGLPTALKIPVAIAKGSRFALAENSGAIRAYVYEESILFSAGSPHIATLQHNVQANKDVAELKKSDGTVIREDHWIFVDSSTNQIQISEEEYDASADYLFSYQSTDRTVLDPAPVADIRAIRACGTVPYASEFVENRDYFLVTEFSDVENVERTHDVAQISTPTVTGTGTYNIGLVDAAACTHPYTRKYDLAVTNVASNVVTFSWKSTPVTPGNEAQVENPVANDLTAGSFTVDISSLPADASSVMEYGVRLRFATGTATPTLGDTVSFQVVAAPTVEVDARHTNTNQYQEATPVVRTVVGANTGTISVNVATASALTYNMKVKLQVRSITGDVVIVDWATAGEEFFTGSLTWDASLAFGSGNGIYTIAKNVTVTLAKTGGGTPVAADFADTDAFSFSVLAARIFPTAKDNREVTLTASSVVYGSTAGTAVLGYASNTPEGGFGTVNVNSAAGGSFQLNGNLNLLVRNMFGAVQSLTNADKFSFSFSNLGFIDWSLTQKASEVIQPSAVYRDVNGTVTGVPGTFYFVVSSIPTGSVVVTDNLGATVTASSIVGTSYVALTAKPTTAITAKYEHNGKEPSPSQTYYLTTLHLRPANLYNTVQFINNRAEGRALCAPASNTNDLYIANEIGWNAIGDGTTGQIALIQIGDADDDRVITPEDVRSAIAALSTKPELTDYTLIGQHGQLSLIIQANAEGNDPFNKRENELWVGAPIGTPVGDTASPAPGTLCYLAQTTLKVYGDDPAHGTRILHGSTEEKITLTMDNGKSQQVTIDGSFMAFYLAALRSKLAPGDTILRKQVVGFDYVQTYENNIPLGTNQIIYFSKTGDKIYRIEEDTTVDKYSFEFSLEMITAQRMSVTKEVRASMDEALVGFVPDTPQAGIATVTSFLARKLRDLVKEGKSAPYQDANGNRRELDPAKDIYVTYDPSKPTRYLFGYGFYVRKDMKELFGTYVVDRDFSSTGLTA